MDAISLIFGMCAGGDCLAAVLWLADLAAAVLCAGGVGRCLAVVGDGLAEAISRAIAWVRRWAVPGRLAGWCSVQDDICGDAGVVLPWFARGPPDRWVLGGRPWMALAEAAARRADAERLGVGYVRAGIR